MDLVNKEDLSSFKPFPTLMPSITRLSKFNGDLLDNLATYRYLVGGLQYYVLTHPETGFTVSKLCQFIQAPTTVH